MEKGGKALLKFVNTPQQYPSVSPAEARKKDFNEIYAQFGNEAAKIQASRCSQCGIPFCQVHCPLQNNIPDWLKLTAEGRLEEAYAVSSATNTFPEICGRICPQDRLCEGNCVIEKGFQAVTIGSIEKFITETAFEQGWVKPFAPAHENGLSVGIIGAGPAGLAAGEWLRKRGYAVHIYDRYDRVGGLMIYGIPNFKLEKEIVQRRREQYEQSGIKFHMNVDIGNGTKFADLRKMHDAMLIATGVYKAREIEIPEASLGNIVPALDYLTTSNRQCLGDKVKAYEDGTLNASGKHVVVIGGGDTAMDCVRTAIRQGAKKVSCLYRRDQANMPGSQREVKNAMEEGVEFIWLSAPKAFVGNGGKVEQILAHKMRLSTPDASGRQSVVVAENSQFTLKADLVLKALGFDAEDLPAMFADPGLQVTKYGTLAVDSSSMMTTLPGVFAAGDIVRGASLVVWAIRDGRDAAAQMHAYMKAKQQKAA